MADRGRGLARPTCGAGVCRSFSVERSHRAPAAWLPALHSGPPPFRCGEVIFPSLLTKTFLHQFQVGKQQKLKSFFHAFQAPLDRLADGLLMYPIGLGNLFDAYAKNDVSVNPAALDLRQGVEGVPQTDEQLHALQKLLGSGLMQAGGVFDPVLTIQGILRLVPGKPPLVGRFIADAGPERLGHFLGDFDKLILRVPIIKIFQIDGSHYKPPFRCWVNE